MHSPYSSVIARRAFSPTKQSPHLPEIASSPRFDCTRRSAQREEARNDMQADSTREQNLCYYCTNLSLGVQNDNPCEYRDCSCGNPASWLSCLGNVLVESSCWQKHIQDDKGSFRIFSHTCRKPGTLQWVSRSGFDLGTDLGGVLRKAVLPGLCPHRGDLWRHYGKTLDSLHTSAACSAWITLTLSICLTI